MNDQAHLNKLRWQCRRGMLELDLFLQGFLENHYLQLSDEDQVLFERLLAESDQDLFTWLTGNAVPEESDLGSIVMRIRHATPR